MWGAREIPIHAGREHRRRERVWSPWAREAALAAATVVWLGALVVYLRRNGDAYPESMVFFDGERVAMRMREERQREARALGFLKTLAAGRCGDGGGPRHAGKACGNFSILSDVASEEDMAGRAAKCDGGGCLPCKLFDPRRAAGAGGGFEFCVGITTAVRPGNSTYLLQTVAALLDSLGVTPDSSGDSGQEELLAAFLYNSNVPGGAHAQAVSGPLGCLLHVEGPSSRLAVEKDWYPRATLAYSDALTVAARANCSWTLMLEDDTVVASKLPARLRGVLRDPGLGRTDCSLNATAGVKLYHTTKYYGWATDDAALMLLAGLAAFALGVGAWCMAVLGERGRLAVRGALRRRPRGSEEGRVLVARLLFVGATASGATLASLLVAGKQTLIPPFRPGTQKHRGAVGAQAILYPRCVLQALANSFTSTVRDKEGKDRHTDLALYPFLKESGFTLQMAVPHLAQHIGLLSGNALTKFSDFHDSSLFAGGGVLGK